MSGLRCVPEGSIWSLDPDSGLSLWEGLNLSWSKEAECRWGSHQLWWQCQPQSIMATEDPKTRRSQKTSAMSVLCAAPCLIFAFLSLDRWMHPPIFYHRWFTLYFGSLQKKMKMLSFQFMEVFSKNSEHNNLSLKCVTTLVKEKGVPNCKWFQIGQPFWLSSLSNFLLFLHWVAFFSYLLWLWLLVRRLQLLPRRHEIILKEIKWKYLYS